MTKKENISFALSLLLASEFVAGNALASQLAPPKEKDKGPFDKTNAHLAKSGDLHIDYTVYVPVITTKFVEDGDRKRRVAVTRLVPERRTRAFSKEAFRVFDTRGKQVSPMVLEKLLAKKREVFVSRDGKLPMLDQLKPLGEDALIIIKVNSKLGKQGRPE